MSTTGADGAEAKDAPTPASLSRSLVPAQKGIGRTLDPSGKLDVSFSGCAVTSSELLMTGHYHEVCPQAGECVRIRAACLLGPVIATNCCQMLRSFMSMHEF